MENLVSENACGLNKIGITLSKDLLFSHFFVFFSVFLTSSSKKLLLHLQKRLLDTGCSRCRGFKTAQSEEIVQKNKQYPKNCKKLKNRKVSFQGIFVYSEVDFFNKNCKLLSEIGAVNLVIIWSLLKLSSKQMFLVSKNNEITNIQNCQRRKKINTFEFCSQLEAFSG